MSELAANENPQHVAGHRRLWVALIAVMVLSFSVLGFYGTEIFRQMPPVPEEVRTSTGETLFTVQDIHNGRNVWQSMGVNSSDSCGVMGHTWRPTGLRTGCTEKRSSCWTVGQTKFRPFLFRALGRAAGSSA